MKLYHLNITTFGSVVPGASHFQGNIQPSLLEDRSTIHIERPMTSKEIARENREAISYGADPIFEPGDRTSSFDTMQDLIDAAIECFKVNFDIGSCALLLGSPASADPQKPLVGPSAFTEQANIIYSAFEQNSGWEGSRLIAKALAKEWDALIREWIPS